MGNIGSNPTRKWTLPSAAWQHFFHKRKLSYQSESFLSRHRLLKKIPLKCPSPRFFPLGLSSNLGWNVMETFGFPPERTPWIYLVFIFFPIPFPSTHVPTLEHQKMFHPFKIKQQRFHFSRKLPIQSFSKG